MKDKNNGNNLDEKAYSDLSLKLMEFYDFDKDKSIHEELIHPGQQVDEVLRLRALRWCIDFLDGIWSKATLDDFKIQYLEGGLTNYLYICELTEDFLNRHPHISSPTSPTRVLLRLYGEIVEHITKFNEGIIFNVMSERKIGPRLLGAFPAGRLEQFIPTTHLNVEDFRSGKYINELAELIARYNMLDIPLNRNPKLFLKNILRWLSFLENNIDISTNLDCEVKNCFLRLKEMKIRNEVDWLLNMLDKIDSPVVFCHNDLQEGNIMFTCKENHMKLNLCLIDYEYSSYHYRGYDLGNHFNEYIYDNFGSNSDGFAYNVNSYPSPEDQLTFATTYLASCDHLLRNKTNEYRNKFLTTPEKLVDEINRYALASHIYWGLWGFVQFKISKIKWGYLKYAMVRFENYIHFKNLWKL